MDLQMVNKFASASGRVWHFCAVVTWAHVHTWKSQGRREVRKTETREHKNETISGTNNWNIQRQNDSYKMGKSC